MLKTIAVTDEYISQGSHYCGSCPVALAINEHLRPGLQAKVTTAWWWINNGPTMRHAPGVANWIGNYDSGSIGMKPITFELEIPDAYLRP